MALDTEPIQMLAGELSQSICALLVSAQYLHRWSEMASVVPVPGSSPFVWRPVWEGQAGASWADALGVVLATAERLLAKDPLCSTESPVIVLEICA